MRTTDTLTLRDQRAEKLQPGEAARVCLARALLHDPALLLVDEPFATADRESASILQFVVQEAAESGKAVLLTAVVGGICGWAVLGRWTAIPATVAVGLVLAIGISWRAGPRWGSRPDIAGIFAQGLAQVWWPSADPDQPARRRIGRFLLAFASIVGAVSGWAWLNV